MQDCRKILDCAAISCNCTFDILIVLLAHTSIRTYCWLLVSISFIGVYFSSLVNIFFRLCMKTNATTPHTARMPTTNTATTAPPGPPPLSPLWGDEAGVGDGPGMQPPSCIENNSVFPKPTHQWMGGAAKVILYGCV